eukprot:9060443-Alexandrium_andersonii.AAC.1
MLVASRRLARGAALAGVLGHRRPLGRRRVGGALAALSFAPILRRALPGAPGASRGCRHQLGLAGAARAGTITAVPVRAAKLFWRAEPDAVRAN